MTEREFKIIINSVLASDVHRTYSEEAGFIAITKSGFQDREVIYKTQAFFDATTVLKFYNIKIKYGKENNNKGSEA